MLLLLLVMVVLHRLRCLRPRVHECLLSLRPVVLCVTARRGDVLHTVLLRGIVLASSRGRCGSARLVCGAVITTGIELAVVEDGDGALGILARGTALATAEGHLRTSVVAASGWLLRLLHLGGGLALVCHVGGDGAGPGVFVGSTEVCDGKEAREAAG